MKVEFKVNLGSMDAERVGVDFRACTVGSVVDCGAAAGKWLVANGIAKELVISVPVVPEVVEIKVEQPVEPAVEEVKPEPLAEQPQPETTEQVEQPEQPKKRKN